MKKFFVFVLLLSAVHADAQMIRKRSMLFMNGTAHLGTGEVIDNSLIGVIDGKIVTVANALLTTPNLKNFDTVINIQGKHVYPGFIAADVSLGLVEVEAVRATVDNNETGLFNPNVRALIAYNTDSKVIPTVRCNGVLLAQVTPRGGIVSGTSSVMKLQGWNWEDAAYKKDEGLHMNWPQNFQSFGWWAEPGETKANDKYSERLNEIRKFFKEAKAYAEETNVANKDVRFEAMRGLFDGSKNLYVHANYVKEMSDAIFFCKDLGIARLVIVGGYDSWMIPDLLRENKVSIILQRLHELPARNDDAIDLPFRIPALLAKSGITYCLGGAGDQEAAQTRNMAFLAGTAASYGLGKEEALKLITLNTAKILGIDKTVGSLESGKEATFFISEGDALDVRSNRITHAWIAGEPVDLNNHQKENYEKYKKKYGL
jgi:imidazolonepropionase-like amidohydrolase